MTKKIMKKENAKLIYNLVVGFNLNEKDVKIAEKEIIKGNIQAKLDLILHNQLVMNNKLNTILSNC